MKQSLVLLALLACVLAGCSEKSGPTTGATNTPTAGEGNALTAPVTQLKAAVDAHQDMVKTVDLTALNKSIDMFQVQEGRFPTNLDELEAKKYIPKIPWPPNGYRLSYNQTKGVVTLEKQ